MAKIYIEVISAGNGRKYEFSVDNTMLIKDVKSKVINQIVNLEKDNISFDSESTILCDLEAQKTLKDNLFLYQENIRSGTMLMIL